MSNRCPKCSGIQGDGEIETRLKCRACMEAEVEAEEADTQKKREEAKIVPGRKKIHERLKLWRADVPDPVGWQTRDSSKSPWGRFLTNNKTGDIVIISEMQERDNCEYAHFSMAKKRGHMCYKDVLWMKEHLVGPDWPAFQVLPPIQEHVNLHTECLHLWVNLDQDPLPDFRKSVELLGKAMQTI